LTTHNNLVVRALYQESNIIPTSQILSDLSNKNTRICNCIPTDQIGIYLYISMLPQLLSDKLYSISTASTKGMWVFNSVSTYMSENDTLNLHCLQDTQACFPIGRRSITNLLTRNTWCN
jgi:hypothetical protein